MPQGFRLLDSSVYLTIKPVRALSNVQSTDTELLPDVTGDDVSLILEFLSQLQLMVVFQGRIRNDDKWYAQSKYLQYTPRS